ncbi:MAG TPA: C45 family autoproteolytic acyltransferase/hydrolase [Woeseiaceae bacterium]|nr:C45 family autoproteolytic acyltransferase/hydrolase [Woeseiaceae bacterium]
MRLTFTAVGEAMPDEKWRSLFRKLWPAYRRWWRSEGANKRPSLRECRAALIQHMPELMPVYERLCGLAGNSDQASRFLSLYLPPAYMAGCSQAVWSGGMPLLVRNYDYHPRAVDALLLHTEWLGRKVLGMSDCLIGLLDGINEDGLAVSLTFGGQRAVGAGFGIPIILRYVLETCSDVDEAADVLQRVPSHMAYNVTVLDKTQRHRTVLIHPGRPALVTHSPVATNQQRQPGFTHQAGTLVSAEREAFLLRKLTRDPGTADDFIGAFMQPPLYAVDVERGFSTLYTAAYRPRDGILELHWPDLNWPHSIDSFEEGSRTVEYPQKAIIDDPMRADFR